MAARAMWKGVIRFDDVAVAVKLYSAVVDKNVSFRLLHREDGVPVKQVLVNPETGKVVEQADAKRGFEVDDDTMVLLEPDELEELEPEASRDIEVLRFVPPGVIDQRWYLRPYYLGPDPDGEGGTEPYFTLAAALGRSNLEGLVRWVMRGTRYVGALRLHAGYPTLVVLRNSEDVIDLDALEAPKGPELDEKQVDMATRLLEMLAGPFEPEAYENEYRERVLEMIQRKKTGGTIEPPKRRKKRPTTDLTEALEASLEEGVARAQG